jgi:DNA invertase Pin-like site-specific DNA recombinase
LDRLWTLVRGRKVDAVLVWRFDRFARSTKQLVDALEEMQHLSVDFVSLHEQIDTSSPMGKAMFTIISAIAEFERAIIRERVRSGLAKAKAQGKRLGRPPIAADKVDSIRKLRGEKQSIRGIARATGVSKSAVHKIVVQA